LSELTNKENEQLNLLNRNIWNQWFRSRRMMEDKSNVSKEKEIGFCKGMKRNHEAEGSTNKPNQAKDVAAFEGRTVK